MTSLNKMQEFVVAWAHERGLYNATSYDKQLPKLLEEMVEMERALEDYKAEATVGTWCHLVEEVGDVLVVVCLQSSMLFFSVSQLRRAQSDTYTLAAHNLQQVWDDITPMLCSNVTTERVDGLRMVLAAVGHVCDYTGTTLEECLASSLCKIHRRKRGQVVNGVYVK